MQTIADGFTVELANGRLLRANACPLTGTPIVDDRELPEGRLQAFSSAKPPAQPSAEMPQRIGK